MRGIHICQKKKSLFPYARLQGPNASWGIVDQKKSARLQVSLISYISLQEPLFANPILRASASKHRSARFPSVRVACTDPTCVGPTDYQLFSPWFPLPTKLHLFSTTLFSFFSPLLSFTSGELLRATELLRHPA